MKKINFKSTFCMLIICIFLSYFAQAKDIIWARYGDLESLDPHKATSTLSLQVWGLIYDTLLATDKDGNAVPHLAKSWKSNSDGTEYTFSLNKGAKCHDGTAMDANDVKYTVEKAFSKSSPSLTKGSWGPITNVEVLNPLTVRFNLKTHLLHLFHFLLTVFQQLFVTLIKVNQVLVQTQPLELGHGNLSHGTKATG